MEINMQGRIALFAADHITRQVTRTFFVLLGAVALLLVDGAGGASAQTVWQKDPDSRVDPVKVVTSALLSAPDITIGDSDTTIAGVSVGLDSTVSDPSDPPSS